MGKWLAGYLGVEFLSWRLSETGQVSKFPCLLTCYLPVWRGLFHQSLLVFYVQASMSHWPQQVPRFWTNNLDVKRNFSSVSSRFITLDKPLTFPAYKFSSPSEVWTFLPPDPFLMWPLRVPNTHNLGKGMQSLRNCSAEREIIWLGWLCKLLTNNCV